MICLPMAGMRPFGLIFKNHSSFCSFFDKLMEWTLHGILSSSMIILAFHPLGVPAVYSVTPLPCDIDGLHVRTRLQSSLCHLSKQRVQYKHHSPKTTRMSRDFKFYIACRIPDVVPADKSRRRRRLSVSKLYKLAATSSYMN